MQVMLTVATCRKLCDRFVFAHRNDEEIIVIIGSLFDLLAWLETKAAVKVGASVISKSWVILGKATK